MFKPKEYTKIGDTGDGNGYPILMRTGEVSEEENGLAIAIPVDDYNAITEHLDTFDDKLDAMEQKVGIKIKPSTFEWIDEIKDSDVPEWGLSYRPYNAPDFNFIPEDSHNKFFDQPIPQNDYRYGVAIHKGNDSDEPSGCFPQDHSLGYLLGSLGSVGDIFTPRLKLPDMVDIKAVIDDSQIRLTTWIHSIVDGVHREQQFTIQKYIGSPPPSIQQPRSTVLVGDDPWVNSSYDEVCSYLDDIKEWKQREKEIDEYWIQRNKIIQMAHTEALTEIEACIKNGEIYVKSGTMPDYNYYEYKINPWAYWVSPKAGVPPMYRDLLKTASKVYRGV